jgi:hypothetical protein
MIDAWNLWHCLRTKADETTDDPDWVATNDPTAGSIDYADVSATVPSNAGGGQWPYTHIEFIIFGVDSARAIQDPATMTITVQLVVEIPRDIPSLGGAAGLEPGLADATALTGVELNKLARFPFSGGTFTLQITSDANDAVDNLEVWFHAVAA